MKFLKKKDMVMVPSPPSSTAGPPQEDVAERTTATATTPSPKKSMRKKLSTSLRRSPLSKLRNKNQDDGGELSSDRQRIVLDTISSLVDEEGVKEEAVTPGEVLAEDNFDISFPPTDVAEDNSLIESNDGKAGASVDVIVEKTTQMVAPAMEEAVKEVDDDSKEKGLKPQAGGEVSAAPQEIPEPESLDVERVEEAFVGRSNKQPISMTEKVETNEDVDDDDSTWDVSNGWDYTQETSASDAAASSTLTKVFADIEDAEKKIPSRRPGGMLSTPSSLCIKEDVPVGSAGSVEGEQSTDQSGDIGLARIGGVTGTTSSPLEQIESDPPFFWRTSPRARKQKTAQTLSPSQTPKGASKPCHVPFFWRTNPRISCDAPLVHRTHLANLIHDPNLSFMAKYHGSSGAT